MALTYATALKTTRMQAVADAVDAGAAAGYLELGTAAFAKTLVTITLDDPCGTVLAGVLTLAGTPLSGTAVDSGLAALARIKDSDGNIIVSGLTCGTIGSGANIEIDNPNIVAAQVINLNSGTITHG